MPTINGGITINGGFTMGAAVTHYSYTVPYPDGVGAPGNFIWLGASLSNPNIMALIALGDLTGWTVTASDNPSLTGTVLSMDPVGYWGIQESYGIPYAAGRQLIFSH
jgi:hypothetical protein